METQCGGIRESGIYGIPAIDIGSRQKGRYDEKMLKNIQHAREDKADILDKLQNISSHRIPSSGFGVGNSTELFFEVLKREDIWNLDIQKIFCGHTGAEKMKKHFALEIFVGDDKRALVIPEIGINHEGSLFW